MKRKDFFKRLAAIFLVPFLPKPKAEAKTYPVGISMSEARGAGWRYGLNAPSTWRYDPTKPGSVELLSGPGVEIKNGDKIIYDYGADGTITVSHWEEFDGKHPKNIKIIDLRDPGSPYDMGLVVVGKMKA